MTSLTIRAHRPVPAPVEAIAPIVGRIDPLDPLRDAMTALTGAAVTEPVREGASDRATTSGLAWTLPSGGRAQITCVVSVRAQGEGSSLVSMALMADASDPSAERQVRGAWPLFRPALESLTARLFRTVAELSDDVPASPETLRDGVLRLAA